MISVSTHHVPVDHRRAVVIGAGPGLGAGIARRFAREGFALTLVARSQETLDAVAVELRAAGASVDTATADAGDPAAFRAALAALAEQAAPGVVVYNVGLVVSDGLLTSDEDHLVHALTVDVVGALTAAQVLTPAMRADGRGTFLVTGGGPALYPDPEHGTLTIGKSALRSAVTVLHEELADDGVHVASVTVVGVIAPGTALDPDALAEEYWALHAQARGEWTVDTVVDGR